MVSGPAIDEQRAMRNTQGPQNTTATKLTEAELGDDSDDERDPNDIIQVPPIKIPSGMYGDSDSDYGDSDDD